MIFFVKVLQTSALDEKGVRTVRTRRTRLSGIRKVLEYVLV